MSELLDAQGVNQGDNIGHRALGRAVAVSYTHLDVYKRQVEEMIGLGVTRFGVSVGSALKIMEAADAR